MDRTWTVGIIGHTGRGDYGHGLDTLYRDLPEVTITCLADPDPGGREATGKKLGVEDGRRYADHREMLAAHDLDVVVIATTYPDRHRDMVVNAAGSGVRGIFCEKPLARSLEEVDAMIAACEASGTKLQMRYDFSNDCALRMRREIDAGRIGEVREVHGAGMQDERGGGLDLTYLGEHTFQIMNCVGGRPTWVQAAIAAGDRMATRGDATPGPLAVGPVLGDHLRATFGYPGGVLGVFCSRKNVGNFLRGVTVYGTEGILFSGGRLMHYNHPCWTPHAREGIGWRELDVEATHPGLARDLLQAIEEGREPLCGLNEARWAMEMISGIYTAHLREKRLSLPLKDRGHPLKSTE